MEHESFPYRVDPATVGCGLVILVPLSVGALWMAATNEQGMVINGILELGVTAATTVIAVMGLTLAGFSLFAVSRFFDAPRELVVTDEEVQIPSGLGMRDTKVVRFDELTDVTEVVVQGNPFLRLHRQGAKVDVSGSMLGDGYERAKALILERVHAARFR